MPLPDQRIQLPAPKIDFPTDVGVTGQDHDNYPAADTQPRFDWMRSYLIGLLCNQSSFDEPTQFRNGTLWYDLNELALKIRKDGEWVPAGDGILVADGVTLGDFYTEFLTLGLTPTIATYTPTGSADSTGKDGDLSYDDDFLYVKTGVGWKRTSLESF
jgi:hypothetical protein